MKFLIDAQLPRRLCSLIQGEQHDAVHTLDLPDGNATTDGALNRLSISEQRVLVTKDADFVNTLLAQNRP